jgi:hypothetical protein
MPRTARDQEGPYFVKVSSLSTLKLKRNYDMRGIVMRLKGVKLRRKMKE